MAPLCGDWHRWLPLPPPLGPYLGWHSHILWYPQGQAHPVSLSGRGRDSVAGSGWHKRSWQRAGRSLPDGQQPRLLPTICTPERRALLETPRPKRKAAAGGRAALDFTQQQSLLPNHTPERRHDGHLSSRRTKEFIEHILGVIAHSWNRKVALQFEASLGYKRPRLKKAETGLERHDYG